MTILVRSMVLGLRGGQEVEAARALGASKRHIIRRHIFPHTAPFVFTQMIFFVPAAILAEAGLAFLGLGDPSLPTWGQILENGFRTGAVFLGYWWWVIGPGARDRDHGGHVHAPVAGHGADRQPAAAEGVVSRRRSGRRRLPPRRCCGRGPGRGVRDIQRAVRASDGVSFTIDAPGEALGVIGESGSGKSSLANAIIRVLPRNARIAGGRVLLAGRDITALPDDVFRREVRWKGIAMVFQGAMHALNPVIRVGDQATERLRQDGVSKRDADARLAGLLDRVGLPRGTGERYPHELSGGMKQRVMIAMALTHDPPLLILDEPTSRARRVASRRRS